MIEAVRRYLAVLDETPAQAADRIERLAQALDGLALAYHHTPESFMPDADDPPELRNDYQATYKLTGSCFPTLGYYPVVSPDALAEPEVLMDAKVMLADAIDDIVDIASDLREVLWRWDNNGQEDAAWYFRFSYQSHWGRHLHDLRSYLHAQQFGH